MMIRAAQTCIIQAKGLVKVDLYYPSPHKLVDALRLCQAMLHATAPVSYLSGII